MGGVALHGAEVKQANTPFNFPSSSFLPQCIMVKPLIHRWLCVTQLTLYIHCMLLLSPGVFKSLNHFSYSHLDCDPHSCSVRPCIVDLQSYRWDQTSLSQMLPNFILYFIQWVHPFFFFVFSRLSILGMHLFGCKFGSERDGDTLPDRKNFDSLLWAIVTVFQVRTTV